MSKPTVWVIAGPKKKGGPNHIQISSFGNIKYLVSYPEFPVFNSTGMTKVIDERLDEFDPEVDYIVWAGGDPASSLLVGSCLLNRGIRVINYLRFDRDTNHEGKRDPWSGTYVPIKLQLAIKEYNK